MARFEQDGTLLGAEAVVDGGVVDGDRLLRLDGALGRPTIADGPADADRAVAAIVAADADAHDEVGPFESGDLALLGVGQAAHASGHRVEDFVELESGAELEPRIDELTQLVVALLEAFEQPRLAQRPGQELAHRRQEVAVPGVVAGLVVVDVDEPVDDAVDDERQREVALEPPLGKDATLLGVDARIVGRSDDDDLLRLDRLPGVGKVVDPQRVSHRLVVVAVAVVAHPTQEPIAIEREDVAVGGVERLDETLGRHPQKLRDVDFAGDERAELDELVQDDVAPPDLVEQRRRVERPPGHVGEPLDESAVLAEVARYVVGQLEDADHRVTRHERHRELGLIAPSFERRPAGRREHRVVEAGGDRKAALPDGDGAARIVAQSDRRTLPRAIEAAAVVAHERPQRLAFDRVDVGDRRVREAREAARDALEDILGRQVTGVFHAGLDQQLEVAVAGLEGGDGVKIGTGGRGAGRAASRRPTRAVAQERLDVDAAEAAVTAGATVADDLAGVAPAPQRVDAHAQQLRRRTEPQPASIGRGRGGVPHGTSVSRLPRLQT